MTSKRLISIIIPVLNEAENIPKTYQRLAALIKEIPAYDFEFFFTDNHSKDGSFEILASLASKDSRIKIIRFSKNFGYQQSIYTGYISCKGDAAIQLDCDLQDPPEMILDFIKKWEEDFQVVYGIRRSRQEGFFITFCRKFFYRLINWMGEENIPRDAGDFRLVDRVVLNQLKEIHDMNPYLRGLITSLGFKQIGIPYDREQRNKGKSKFRLGDLLGLALDGIVNHSIFPLRIASWVGLAISLLTAMGLLGYAIGRIFFDVDWPAGFATTTILLLFSISLNGIFLGIIGEYLGRIYKQVKKRPLVVVERALNLEEGETEYASCHSLRG